MEYSTYRHSTESWGQCTCLFFCFAFVLHPWSSSLLPARQEIKRKGEEREREGIFSFGGCSSAAEAGTPILPELFVEVSSTVPDLQICQCVPPLRSAQCSLSSPVIEWNPTTTSKMQTLAFLSSQMGIWWQKIPTAITTVWSVRQNTSEVFKAVKTCKFPLFKSSLDHH